MDDSFPEDYLEDDRSGTSDPEALSAEETIEVDDAPPKELPQKTADQLTKSDIQRIIKAEKKLGRTFLFAVNRKDKHSIYVYLHYNRDGNQDAALRDKPCQFIRCTVCEDLMHAHGGHIGRHTKKHEGTPRASTPMSASSSISSFMPKTLNAEEKGHIAGLLANYAIDSGAPFRSLESDPMHKLVVGLINFGVRRKHPVDVSTILPVRNTIATHCSVLSNARINKAVQMVEPFKDHGGAISLDYGHRVGDYLAVVCHFIETTSEGWKLRALPVGFEGADELPNKEAPQIWLHLLDAVEAVGLREEHFAGAFCVTDEGSNVLSMAREHFHGIKCAAHVLNTIGYRTFHLYASIRANGSLTLDEIVLIDHAKDVLGTAQLIANNVALELGFKPTRGADTRWLSSLNVCRDITRVLDRLVQMKQDPEWAKRMGNQVVDAITKLNGLRNELSACTALLTHFEEPVTTLQAENFPTLHLVWKYFLQLRKTMSDSASAADGSDFSRAIAKSCFLAIEYKRNEGFITEAHKVATFLDPRKRHLRHLTEEDRAQIHDKVRVDLLNWGPPATQFNESSRDERMEADLLEDQPDKRPQADEVESYINAYFAETSSTSFDILEFWSGRETQFTGLAVLALKYLAIPASSAACERAFRRLKLLIPDSRESLKPETVSKLMLARHY